MPAAAVPPRPLSVGSGILQGVLLGGEGTGPSHVVGSSNWGTGMRHEHIDLTWPRGRRSVRRSRSTAFAELLEIPVPPTKLVEPASTTRRNAARGAESSSY